MNYEAFMKGKEIILEQMLRYTLDNKPEKVKNMLILRTEFQKKINEEYGLEVERAIIEDSFDTYERFCTDSCSIFMQGIDIDKELLVEDAKLNYVLFMRENHA